MQPRDNNDRRAMLEKLARSLMLLSFGLALLAYLIAIDRPQWFDLRPASGTATAMANASRERLRQYDLEDEKGAKSVAEAKGGSKTVIGLQ